jgi:hypothetical protein
MANDTINQSLLDFQEKYKKLLAEVVSIQGVLLNIREHCLNILPLLPATKRKEILEGLGELSNHYNDLNHKFNEIEDMQKQQSNKPIIIREKDNE